MFYVLRVKAIPEILVPRFGTKEQTVGWLCVLRQALNGFEDSKNKLLALCGSTENHIFEAAYKYRDLQKLESNVTLFLSLLSKHDSRQLYGGRVTHSVGTYTTVYNRNIDITRETFDIAEYKEYPIEKVSFIFNDSLRRSRQGKAVRLGTPHINSEKPPYKIRKAVATDIKLYYCDSCKGWIPFGMEYFTPSNEAFVCAACFNATVGREVLSTQDVNPEHLELIKRHKVLELI